jgi:hypothetical protein
MTVDTGLRTVSTVVAQDYETLRTAALGDGPAFEARNGLALFLRRGMWGWARASSDPCERLRPIQPVRSRAVVDSDDKALIQLLAAVAMSAAVGSSHERKSQGSDASPGA